MPIRAWIFSGRVSGQKYTKVLDTDKLGNRAGAAEAEAEAEAQ